MLWRHYIYIVLCGAKKTDSIKSLRYLAHNQFINAFFVTNLYDIIYACRKMWSKKETILNVSVKNIDCLKSHHWANVSYTYQQWIIYITERTEKAMKMSLMQSVFVRLQMRPGYHLSTYHSPFFIKEKRKTTSLNTNCITEAEKWPFASVHHGSFVIVIFCVAQRCHIGYHRHMVWALRIYLGRERKIAYTLTTYETQRFILMHVVSS